MFILQSIYSGLVVLVLFGLTIFLHELGHFIAARRLGLVVDAFALGFGKPIWKRTIDGVTYKVCWLPFGGYVALPQLDPSAGNPNPDAPPGERQLPRIEPWKRIVVSVAGPIGNVVFAFILAYIIYWGGQSYRPPESGTIGYVSTNSTAYVAGLRAGDSVTAVNGRGVKSWEDVVVNVALSESVTVTVRKATGETSDMALASEKIMGTRFVRGVAGVNYCYVLHVQPGSSAEQAGMLAADRIVAFDGSPVLSREQLIDRVAGLADRTVTAVVDRKGQSIEMKVTPKFDPELNRARIGVQFSSMDIRKPVDEIKADAMMLFRVLQALFTPHEARAVAEGAGGPVAILVNFWWSVQVSILVALSFAVFINVNLAVFNLLPFPVLDGGHVTISVWEIVTRRPVGPKVVNWLWNAGAVFLISLILFLTGRDIFRLLPGRGIPSSETNAPPAAVSEPSK